MRPTSPLKNLKYHLLVKIQFMENYIKWRVKGSSSSAPAPFHSPELISAGSLVDIILVFWMQILICSCIFCINGIVSCIRPCTQLFLHRIIFAALFPCWNTCILSLLLTKQYIPLYNICNSFNHACMDARLLCGFSNYKCQSVSAVSLHMHTYTCSSNCPRSGITRSEGIHI